MKTIITILFITLSPVFVQAQNLFGEEATWFGLDFSHVKFYGKNGFNDIPAIKNHWFNSWNQLILNENEKYDVAKFFQKSNLDTNLTIVTERNAAVDEKQLTPTNEKVKTPNLTANDISKIISEYQPKHSKEIGIVFIVDSFSKKTENAIIHVVFFNTKSHKVLLSNHYTAGAGGFGFRNFWARSIHTTLSLASSSYRREKGKARRAAKKAAKAKK